MISLRTLPAIAFAVALPVMPAAYAQPSQGLQQVELAELSPEKRAEVQARATGGNSVREVLEVMLLNNIKLRYPANRIVALDFGRGAVVYEVSDGQLRVANFDKRTLEVKS